MFGHHKMTHVGTAKVVSCEMHLGGWVSANYQGQKTTTFDLILDVTPQGAPPFRCEAHERFSELVYPDSGDTLRVRCNPEKRAVKIDLSEDMRFNSKLIRRANAANAAKHREEHARILAAPPGTPAAGGSGAADDPKLAGLERRTDATL